MAINASRKTFIRYRFSITLLLLASIICAVIGKLYHLQIVEKDFLQQQSKKRTEKTITIPAYRGMILDRFENPLAVSTPISSLWVNPSLVDINDSSLNQLAKILKVTKSSLQNRIKRNNNREFVYIARHISPEVVNKIYDTNINYVNVQEEYKRYYPNGDTTSHLIGFTDIDDRGQEGLELALNKELAGNSGKKIVRTNSLGKVVETLPGGVRHKSGEDITLSIDLRLQFSATQYLKEALAAHDAKSASAVVLDVNTGEVLTMVNAPTFNPNKKRDLSFDRYRNIAVTDSFEPGSVMKAFSMVSVLEHTNTSPQTIVDTGNGVMHLQGNIVRDVKKVGKIQVADILQNSSNIGITKLVQKIESNQLFDTLDRFGFGQNISVNYPGVAKGSLQLPREDQEFVKATMSFGYGLASTPLQLARAFAILGANGIKYPLTFTRVDNDVVGEQVIEPEVCHQVIGMLTKAAQSSASRAKVQGFKVAGKTGTVRMLNGNKYQVGQYRAVYGGIAPAVNPRFAIVVVVHEPNGEHYYGNLVAAPIFAKIASQALRLYNVAPDVLDTHGVHLAQNGNTHS